MYGVLQDHPKRQLYLNYYDTAIMERRELRPHWPNCQPPLSHAPSLVPPGRAAPPSPTVSPAPPGCPAPMSPTMSPALPGDHAALSPTTSPVLPGTDSPPSPTTNPAPSVRAYLNPVTPSYVSAVQTPRGTERSKTQRTPARLNLLTSVRRPPVRPILPSSVPAKPPSGTLKQVPRGTRESSRHTSTTPPSGTPRQVPRGTQETSSDDAVRPSSVSTVTRSVHLPSTVRPSTVRLPPGTEFSNS